MMKTLCLFLSLFILPISTFAQASACLGKFCVGDGVIDGFDHEGKVTGFNEATASIFYLIDGYSSPSTASQSDLSKRVVDVHFPVNKRVIDEYDHQGKVMAAYENGHVAYRIDGYSTNSFASNLMASVSEWNGISAGKRVIDQWDHVGTAKDVFEDGRISYLINGYSAASVSKEICVEVTSKNGLTAGNTVIDQWDHIGKLIAVYSDGRAEYLIDGYSTANVNKSLTPRVDTLNGFFAKETVIDQWDHIGVVQNVFADGRVSFLISGYSTASVEASSSMSYQIPVSTAGVKTDTTVIDQWDHIGKVITVFKDGRCQYLIEGYSTASVGSQISPEVETSKAGYLKATEYADDNGRIGKPTRFFENGRVEVALSLYGSKTVVGNLYPEVDSLKDLSKGTLVVFPTLKSYPVERIFSNRTVEVSIPKKQSAPAEGTEERTYIVANADQMDEFAGQWLESLKWMVIDHSMEHNPDQLNRMLEVYPVLKGSYPALREAIVKKLNDRNSDFDRKEKALLLAYLVETLPEQ